MDSGNSTKISFNKLLKEYVEFCNIMNTTLVELNQCLTSRNAKHDQGKSNEDWLTAILDHLSDTSLTFRNRMFNVAESSLAAINAIDSKEYDPIPPNEDQCFKDIFWLSANVHRWTGNNSKDLTLNQIFQDLMDGKVFVKTAWTNIIKLVGKNAFVRNIKKEQVTKETIKALTENDHENFAALKVLFGTVLEHVLIEKVPYDAMGILTKVASGKLQATLALGDLLQRFPDMFGTDNARALLGKPKVS